MDEYLEKYLNISLAAPKEYVVRKKDETESKLRTAFMRDRDRIFFSKAFRRLSGKTQVFTANYNDHARTRLTHTLEVSQLSRTVAKYLNLDIDLTEAIAYGHDLGHTPFGHVGEQALNNIMNECEKLETCYGEEESTIIPAEFRGFKHNHQSVRVVALLEQYYKNDPGLNLTNYTLWGMRAHTKLKYKDCQFSQIKKGQKTKCFYYPAPKVCKNERSLQYYDKYDQLMRQDPKIINDKFSWSFEAFVVKYCDEIAQRHHDIEDGLEIKILTNDVLINKIKQIFKDDINNNPNHSQRFTSCIKSVNKKDFIPNLSRFIVNLYLSDLTITSYKNLLSQIIEKPEFKNWKDLYPTLNLCEVEDYVGFSTEFAKKDKLFEKFLQNSIWNSFAVQRMDGYGTFVIKKLFKAFVMNQQQLPDYMIYQFYKDNYPKFIDRMWISQEKKDKKNAFDLSPSTDSEKFTKIVGILRVKIIKDGRKNFKKFRPLLYRTICDYIASMTDAYAIKEYQRLFQTTPFDSYMESL